ncbi:MAG: hypothetical protein N3G21_10045 [Candidatus Hydrogenedentes bacterium]|nr:hypothetical protein [Candidatus Hydrogenedentota bacterium]
MEKLLVLCVAFLVFIPALAEDVGQPIGVTITGTNVGLIETLAKGENVSTNTAIAQLNGLKVKEAKDVDGKVLEDLKDKIIYYLPTKSADNLISGDKTRGKEITIIGKLYKSANAILVEEVQGHDGGAEEDMWDVLPTGKKSQIQEL